MAQKLWWYSVRASGLVAWLLVTATVVWGLLLSSRSTRRPRPAWVLDLHRFLAGLSFAFIGIHLVGLTFDRWVGFGVRELFVPMASEYRPGAVAWGIVAMYLLLAVHVTSLLMHRLPRRVWHVIHLSSFGVFVATTVHAIIAGADGGQRPVQVFAVASSAAVVVLAAYRVVVRLLATVRRRRLQARLLAHEHLHPRTLRPVDEAIAEVVARGDAHDRVVARHGHHRRRIPRGTPR